MLWTLAADSVSVIPVPSSLDGVTTAMVGYLLLCMAFPNLVKDRKLFLGAFGITVLILGVSTLRYVLIGSPAMQVFGSFLVGLLQIALLIALFLASGGLSVSELAGEMKQTVDGLRGLEEAAAVAKAPAKSVQNVDPVQSVDPVKPIDLAPEPAAPPPRKPPAPPPGPLPVE